MKKNVIKALAIIAVAFMPLLYTGCAGCQQDLSHMKSQLVGLNRKITLYANDGSVIKQWETRGTVEDQGGSFRFLANGKAVTLAGTVVIEEQ